MTVPQAGAPSKPRVLVLLASRDGATGITRQLASVIAQEDVEVRVQIRDDDSTDATRELVKTLADRDERIQLLPDHAPSGSASANFFKLIHQADASSVDYVALCDQDDIWLPRKLKRAVGQLRESGAQGYSAAVVARWPDGRERMLVQEGAVSGADYLFEGAGQGCTFVIESGLFLALQVALDSHSTLQASLHYHDWALYALARSAGATWFFDREPTMVYLQHDRNDTGARSSGAGIVRRLFLIRSGWYRSQVRAISTLVQVVNPGDCAAAEWSRLDGSPSRASLAARWRRARFIARAGRRKKLDRCIQIAAVAFAFL